jgi:outer membrane protein OmpA-like peptidoglycan-associated protein
MADGMMKVDHVPAPINSISDDFSFVIDYSTDQAYVSSNRTGGKGSDDIYKMKMQFNPKHDISVVTNLSSEKVVLDEFQEKIFPIDTVTQQVNAHLESEPKVESQVVQNVQLLVPDYKVPILYFELNRFELTTESKLALNELSIFLNSNQNLRIELCAHTDCRGTASYNMSLSQKRASESKAYLNALLINKNQVLTKGCGETQLRNSCDCTIESSLSCDEVAHGMNRRIEFKWIELK